MFRHRSPSGRDAHQRPGSVALPGALPARHRADTRGAVRNGLTAAAVAGGTLAVVAPTVVVTSSVADAAPSAMALVRLADGDDLPIVTARFATVTTAAEPPPQADVAGLLKAAGLADVVRKAAEEQAAREASADCDADLDGLGRVRPWVRDAARFLSCLYEEPDLGGVAPRGRQSDHPSGHAVDLMVRGERGDRIAECALANQDELGVAYVLWEQRANYGDGWERMSDRGGDTANHLDHVHISFDRSAPDGDALTRRCD